MISDHLNITECKEAEKSTQREIATVQAVLESVSDAVIIINALGTVDYLNPIAEKLTGWSLQNAYGQSLNEVFILINEDTYERLPDPLTYFLNNSTTHTPPTLMLLVNRDSCQYPVEISTTPVNRMMGETSHEFVLVFRNVDEQRRLIQEVSYQATHDHLTGLINRREFNHRLQRVLDITKGQQAEHALCYLDLDQFKIINDICGYIAGDELLRQLAKLLRKKIRHRDTLSRLGSDEFGILLEHCPIEQAMRIIHSLCQAVNELGFFWDNKRFSTNISAGLVIINAASDNLTTMLQAADNACYVAKEAGGNRLHLYHPNDIKLARRHGEILRVTHIQQALREDHFKLYAQQIFKLQQHHKSGPHFELLLRLEDEHGHLIMPDQFIPIAERYQMATHIDRWVIKHAFHWLSEHPDFLSNMEMCSINLSGNSIEDQSFQIYALRQFEQTGIPAQKICFEITETATIDNFTHVNQFIKTLKALGCYFALDDFGSGFSSFGYLKKLPVDFLKIDGMFIKDIVDNPIGLAMVRSINDIGHQMGKKTIAEYVESDQILTQLRQLGVDYAQGYQFSEPQPLEVLAASI